MSNDITSLRPNAGASQLPAAFQGAASAPIFHGQQFESAADGMEGSYGVIKYAGKVFSLQYRGQNYKFLRPDDGTPRGSIDVIFVQLPRHKAKTYYENYTEGSKERPLCWSNDSITPDAAVPFKQSPACATCPKNVFGSRTTENGTPAKQCSDHKRTAVVLDPQLALEVLGAPLSEAVLLRIPAASLNDFGTFGTFMDKQNHPIQSIVTRIKFDPTKPFPKLQFEGVRPLSNAEGEIAIAIRNETTTQRIVAEVATDGGMTVVAPGPLTQGIQQIRQDAQPAPVTSPEPPPHTVIPPQAQMTQQVSGPVGGGMTAAAMPTATAQPPTQNNVVQMDIIPRPTPQQQADDMPVGDPDFEAKMAAKLKSLLD